MKKLLLVLLLVFSTSASAYMIGGAWAYLLKCEYGQWGYEYGMIGTYDVNGQIHQVFFGSNYCKH